MAQGDVINGIASVAAGANLNYQPAIGEHVIIKSVVGRDMSVGLSDGTLSSRRSVRQVGASDADDVFDTLGNINLCVNNAVYFQMRNFSAVSITLAYSGIQIK